MTPETIRANCGDDESLFEYAQGGLDPDGRRAVEAHVNTCPDCRRVLAEALRGLAETNGDDGSDGMRQRIGRYSLVELLGAGAFGVVYRAFDPELERTVALKLLRTDASDASEENRERRLREARTMARVSDPNVVTVFDAGLSGGSVYIVMEYVQGSTLEEWLAREPRTLREIVEAFIAAGRGLAALHARSLVHRDFKPENVMIGSDGRIQVTDFGLARAIASVEAGSLQGEAKPGSRVTLTHGLFGTPAYMAPELFEGKPADARSDQFSFAVALVSAATGCHPFGADEPISVPELVLRLHRDRGELAEKTKALPGRLRDHLVRALSVEPADRFPSMAALLSELERVPIPAVRDGSRRARWAAALALAVVVVAVFVFLAPPRSPHEGKTLNERVAASQPVPVILGAPAPVTSGAIPTERPTAEPTPPVEETEARQETERPAMTASSLAPAPKGLARGAVRRPARKTPAPSEARYDDRLKDPF